MKNTLSLYSRQYTIAIVTMSLLLAFSFSACENFLEVDAPPSQLTADAVFENKTTANAAVAEIYADMRDSGMFNGNATGMGNQLGNYTDELVYYGDISYSTQQFYNNTVLPSSYDVGLWWSSAYSQVYSANAVMEGTAASASLDDATKAQLQGEALFLRAVIHFQLANIFGNVPYITATDFQPNSKASRLTVAEVYNRAIDDLVQAADLLPENYAGTERTRATKSVAMAFLARVYLYAGYWAEAADAASYTINNEAVYTWVGDLDAVFKKESTTTIWSFQPAFNGQNSGEGETFIFSDGPPPLVALREGFADTFEAGDLRRSYWIQEVSDGTSIWLHANKYKERFPTEQSVEYSIVLRLAEQYLIRAEARVRQGDLIGTAGDINKIRNNAGLADTTAATAEDLLEAILTERQHELFTEGGHRFFDLKRFNRLDAVLSTVKPGWNGTDKLLPVPESELLLNPNLEPQNPGY